MGTLVVVLTAIAVITLVVIVLAPWRRIRAEKPLPTNVETRILLGEDPHRIAADLDAAEQPVAVEPPELRTAEMQALRAIGDTPPPPPQPE